MVWRALRAAAATAPDASLMVHTTRASHGLALVLNTTLDKPRCAALARTVQRTTLSQRPKCTVSAVTRVDAHGNDVGPAIRQKVGHVEAQRGIGIVVATDQTAVDEHQHVTDRTVELDPDATPDVARRDLEFASIPADAGFRVASPKRLVSV
jgi:hypothetical protein